MSNKLLDNLNFKTLTMPTWFGKTREQMLPAQKAAYDFLNHTLISDVVDPLLDIEFSAQYWYEADVWPYPDKNYIKRFCAILDRTFPEDFELHVRTFYFGFLWEFIHGQIYQQLQIRYEQRLKQQ